jgi:hypothetical protein
MKATLLGSCKMPLPALLDCVGQVFSFLWAEVLCGNIEVNIFALSTTQHERFRHCDDRWPNVCLTS